MLNGTTMKKTNHLLMGESCTSFRESMDENYEYANKFGKQG